MKLDVFFDYACPYCYVGHSYLKDLLPGYENLEVVWRPCEAHPEPEPRSVLGPEAPSWWRALKPYADQEGLVMNLPHSPVPHSDLAIQGMYCVQEHEGDLWAYHDQIYKAVFVASADIEDLTVLLECADKACVPVAEFEEALRSGRYAAQVKASNHYAWGEMGVPAVPTFVCGTHRLDSVPGVGVTKPGLDRFLAAICH